MRFNLASKTLAGQVGFQLRGFLAGVGGANTPEIKDPAVILTRSLRRVLSVRGGGAPSRAGEAPRRQKGALAKSVAQGVVGPGRRIAVLRFTGRLLEGGVSSTGKRKVQIARRPFMDRALADVQDKMVDVTVTRLAAKDPPV